MAKAIIPGLFRDLKYAALNLFYVWVILAGADLGGHQAQSPIFLLAKIFSRPLFALMPIPASKSVHIDLKCLYCVCNCKKCN